MHPLLAGSYMALSSHLDNNTGASHHSQPQLNQQQHVGQPHESTSNDNPPAIASLSTPALPISDQSPKKQSQHYDTNSSTYSQPHRSRIMPHRQRRDFSPQGSQFIPTQDPSGMNPSTISSTSTVATPNSIAQMEHTNYLISDSKLLNFLMAYEPLCKLVTETVEVFGYELYIVEQWACERRRNSCIISFTGNPKHKVQLSIISLPKDAKLWNAFTQSYFDELFKTHARPRTTELGCVYVSNLSSFPSNLNLVPVIGGSVKEGWGLFEINENLKRTGCGGRVVLSLTPPSNASEDKFRQLFKTNESVPIDFAVRELVVLVQLGLFYCNLLAPQLVDGLLCNETQKAVNQWWSRWGVSKYHTRPPASENTYLTPRSVAGIIGFITGIRNRMATIIGSSKAAKDPFDVHAFLESLRHFQKHQHLPRTIKIDEATVELLYSLTNTKVTNSDFFGMVKSTMKEVSGKVYQGVADVETLDIERMRNFLQGARTRYLWLGRGDIRKPIKHLDRVTLSLGIPLSSLSPTEAPNDFKWSEIAKRTIPRNKKVFENGIVQSENPSNPVLVLTPDNGTKSTALAVSDEKDTPLYNIDDILEGERLNLHKLKKRVKTRKHRLRKYINGQPPKIFSDDEALSGHEIEGVSSGMDDDYFMGEGEISDATTSGAEDAAICNNGESNLYHEDSDESEACKLDGQSFDVDLTAELRRRHSISAFSKQKREYEFEDGYHNIRTLTNNPSYKLSTLRRSQSFSLVEGHLLSWSVPWETPSSVLARHYKTALQLQCKVQKQTCRMEEQRSEYQALVRRLQGRIEKDRAQLSGRLTNDMHALRDREKGVQASLDDVEALIARLLYETRLLDGKMRDVEEAVELFGSKVGKLEQRVKGMSDLGFEKDVGGGVVGWFKRVINVV